MSLSAGTKLGPYEILASIGKGGMGEVYKAHDPRTGRDVAIKVSAEEFSERFDREARAIAALNHPNICHLYDVGPNYLVMELVEGEPPKGPLPLDEALRITKQIADALEEAHGKGIVHRDLKPGNIKIKPDGTVKVLDFGLVQLNRDREEAALDPANSPTLTMAATQAGMILGTAGYMSPEQARGKQVDKRADIWAFGVVLYELLTGKRLFQGDDVTDTLAAVLRHEPDWEQVPAKVRRLLRRCLAKDPAKRLRDIGDVWELLDEVPQATAPSRSWLGWGAWGVAGMLAIALGFVSYRHVREEPPHVLKMSILPPDKATFKPDSLPAVSPDGRRLAFVATLDGKDQLWVRDLDSLAARALTGTDGASYPFWSPDSRTIAFFADGRLKKIEVAGGPALSLCDAAAGRGGTWSNNDVIVFGVAGGGALRVSAAGGSPAPVTILDQVSGETSHRFPWFLPDGRHYLYSTSHLGTPDKNGVYVVDLDSKNRKLVVTGDSNAVYSPPGYLLFVREQTLMAQPFDVGKLQTTGDAVPIAEKVDYLSGRNQNQFSVSQTGVLAYTSGGGEGGLQLTWFDRSGKVTGTLGAPSTINWGAISPDGKTVAVDQLDAPGSNDIWLHDLVRGTISRFTFGPKNNVFPVWSPDGNLIAFFSNRDNPGHPFQKPPAGRRRTRS
jgi:Tol biopolymer transport system component/tRNA A-37 threonylcarbamoyl transferase component Bud32